MKTCLISILMFINPTQQQLESINAPSTVRNILSMLLRMQDGAIIQFTYCNLYQIIRFKSPLPLTLLLRSLFESNEWLYNSKLVYAITLSQQIEHFILSTSCIRCLQLLTHL